jgi:hypothetical protein
MTISAAWCDWSVYDLRARYAHFHAMDPNQDSGRDWTKLIPPVSQKAQNSKLGTYEQLWYVLPDIYKTSLSTTIINVRSSFHKQRWNVFNNISFEWNPTRRWAFSCEIISVIFISARQAFSVHWIKQSELCNKGNCSVISFSLSRGRGRWQDTSDPAVLHQNPTTFTEFTNTLHVEDGALLATLAPLFQQNVLWSRLFFDTLWVCIGLDIGNSGKF